MKLKARDIWTDTTIDLGHGYTASVECPYDTDHGAPWENEDGHGPVSDWRRHNTTTGRPDKRPGEMLLCRDGRMARFYDFAAAVKLARKDGWGSRGDEGLKPGEKAARAALADFEYLRRWCENDWHYIGVCVTVFRAGQEIGEDSIWGVESCPNPHNNNEYYWQEIAIEMIENIVTNCQEQLRNRATARRKENRERRYWNERDVITR